MKKYPQIFYPLFLIILLISCRKAEDKPLYNIQQSAISKKAMTVSAHPLASKIGADILRKGGNAIDATIAIQFALAVTYPRAGNLGGGGFMIIRTDKGEINTLDYREKAPLTATKDMYLDSIGNVVEGLSRNGHLAVGVPGTVDGMVKAHKRFGQLKNFKLLVEPAIQLAEEGFKITPLEAERLNNFQDDFKKYNPTNKVFVKTEKWKTGDLLVQKELAETLRRIRDKGRAGFYEGKTADLLVAEMKQQNGIISLEDLQKYQSKWRDPIIGHYKNYKIISMPPPSSGGIALVQMLKIVEKFPLSKWGFHSPQAIHLMAEAERRVYADRAKHLGDDDFYPVPKDSLLDEAYLLERMADYDTKKATESDAILAGKFNIGLESFETTHTSVVDSMGNAVSVTTTINSNYGSKVIVDGAGFFLNNEMDDFSAKPGVPNQFGLVGAEANAVAPEKRMLSSMTPTIIEKDGGLFMVLGSPGGSTIITSVFQVFLNVAEFGMNLEDAVKAKRFHHQWLPDEIMYEKEGFDAATLEQLKSFGHQLNGLDKIGLVKAIHVMPDGNLNGVGDNRSEDHAEGL